MNFKKFLMSESMTITVQGHQNEDLPKDVYWLSVYIKQKLRGIPEFNLGTNSELFTLDGLDTSSTNGVLNFYTQGIPQNKVPTILKGALYYLKELGVDHGEPKADKSKMFSGEEVIRIPVKMHPKPSTNAPELNMANEMAHHLFSMLNIQNELYHGSISAHDLLIKIDNLPEFQITKSVVKPSVDKNVHSFGMNEERIRRNLEQLRNIAKWAIENGYASLSVS